MTSSRRPVLPGPGGALALLLGLVYFTSIAWPMLGAIRGQPGIDFFQYWAVAGIRPTLPAGAVNPYAHTPEYEHAIALSVLERGERDPLRILSARPHLDLTNTPLLYALASLLPARYERALGLHRALQGASVAATLLRLPAEKRFGAIA
jgi:hypothetical protein